MKSVTTFLGFSANAEEAVDTYVKLFSEVFGNSEKLQVTRFDQKELSALESKPEMQTNSMPGAVGSVKAILFTLNGEEIVAFNGGDYFGKFNESMSLYVTCETQDQIDRLWAVLSDGGTEQPCGWVTDRFGVAWQIVPSLVWDIDQSNDRQKAERMNTALFDMKKIDITELKKHINDL